MISIIVTAWEEPKEVKECLRRLTTQKDLNEKYEILAIAPDEPTKKEILNYSKKYKNIKFTPQPRQKGKNEMLNLLMKKAKGDILIFMDGDIFVNETAISNISKTYKKNPKIGALTGKILPKNSRKNKFGYWAGLLTHVMNKIREHRFNKKEFLECSGYLYSIKKGIIRKIPLDVAEDSIMPLLIWKKGYKIAYVENAIGYVEYPENYNKWFSQKVRCAKSHEMLDKYGGKKVRMKTFKNEVLYGILWSFNYPKNIKEVTWTFQLFLARLLVWLNFSIETKIKGNHYGERWEKIHAK